MTDVDAEHCSILWEAKITANDLGAAETQSIH
jgi:hypothetical protein